MVRLVSANPRNVSDSGWSVLPPPDSRRQRALIEPVELFTRLAMSGFGPNPAGGFAAKTVSLRTRFESNGSADFHVRVFPARPHSRRVQVHEIESKDYSRLVTGDYFQKPLSNVASHSRGTTLYGT